MIALMHFFRFLRRTSPFYCCLLSVSLAVIVFPVTYNLPILELLYFVIYKPHRLIMTQICVIMLGITGIIIYWHIKSNRTSSTITRKIFHIILIAIYVPALYIDCTYLYVASCLTFAIFLMLEVSIYHKYFVCRNLVSYPFLHFQLARVVRLHPFADVLKISVSAFVDSKDSGKIVLTPIYLLAGCSLPLWLHPHLCARNNFLALSSGVLSVGIGDTAASYFGYKYGKRRIPGTNKSMEGCIANMICQGLAILISIYFGVVDCTAKNVILSSITVYTTAYVEAKSDQIDNLTLPLIAYAILSL